MPDQLTGLKFDLEWRTSLLTAIMVPCLVLLGFWQLQRAEEKTALAASWEARRQQTPVPLSSLDWHRPESLAYVPVKLRGEFSPDKFFLLDNRIRDGRFGYEVLAIFKPHDAAVSVLVNRGWVLGDPARLSLPGISPVPGEVQFTGHIHVAPDPPYLLAEQVLGNSWPQRIQAVEMQKLSPLIEGHTGAKAFPYPVRIDAGQAGALEVDWLVINVSPDKHVGYAMQWFALAGALGLLYIFRSTNLRQLVSARRGAPE